MQNIMNKLKTASGSMLFWPIILIFAVFAFFYIGSFTVGGESYSSNAVVALDEIQKEPEAPVLPPLDKEAYDKKLVELANNPPQPGPIVKKVKQADGTFLEETIVPPPRIDPWPVKNLPYPNAGAILPFKRVVAYYGNLYSTKMGVLGQYPETEMISRLDAEVKKWELADPETPVVPALHYIAVVAQAGAGADGKYRARMPDSEIQKVLQMAKKADAIVFLDIQVGFSDLQTEVPLLEKYLKLPNVHLGIDPEFSMKTGVRPGKIVGTLDASDINFTAEYLAKIVQENNLTPKILVVHRYTEKMVTNYKLIKPLPEVQIVMHMDGWGGKAKKLNTYKRFVQEQPVQFTGFKLFYKNDVLDKGTVLMTPEEVLDETVPNVSYVQYQ